MDGRVFGTGRVEAFSDGVFAIAITLLVLDLNVPGRGELEGRSLAGALGHEWPAYVAYLVSFLVIGIIWVNHHALCRLARQVDRTVLFANLFLLLVVTVIPFPTRVLAAYLTSDGQDAHTAAALYSATMTLMGVAFTLLYLAFVRDAGRSDDAPDRVDVTASLRRFGVGSVLYVGTIGLSFVSAPLTLGTHAAIALYYCFDQLTPTRVTSEAETAEPGPS